ncbi:hypothetical protein FXV77_15685 [Sphingobacterium phlebotomi]|uniref:Tetratricopeptide repeat protein n=1 Tax=Sphingobacterium phlebotomi TaxID=2605433 RepID=A0A5D4H352_9SPHI|nr:hypothetical protein [Sphingobacterium phlebotomi]TYR34459.1 hypothetical protein FXV77_15685 [Sphingobacterium phlebotomi]
MGNQGASFTHLYHQALLNPKDIALTDFEQLLAQFPYSQPLHFAFERRKFLQDEPPKHLENRAVLLASNANWLAEYVQLPVGEVPIIEVEDDDYVPFEDIAASSEELEMPPVEESLKEEKNTRLGEQQDDEQIIVKEEEGKDVLETLVQEGVGGGDYFAVHVKDIQFEQTEERGFGEEEQVDKEKKEEDISLYNDELMPYSFRWWLHKTRLEHADTYQPFASPQLPTANKSSFDPAVLDKVILDQQIREHIIHLQNPEDKLSEEVKQREIASNKPNKVTEVIERFIREEPQIQPPQPENINVENKARKSSEEQFDLVTETLASIYADQAMYVKAIEVYKKLILRFPEKKSYFATRIKELEEKLY